MTTEVKHPAKYSPQILDCIRGLLNNYYYKPHGGLPSRYTLRDGAAVQILDCFGGTGGIHDLSYTTTSTLPYYDTYAIELEPEWADESAQRGMTWQGDWLLWDPGTGNGQQPFTYHDVLGGNAHAWQNWLTEPHAIVTSTTYANRMADHHNAKDGSRRITYKHALGRDPSPGSSCIMQWGPEYRAFHVYAWRKAHRVLPIGGLLIINIKDHVRGGKVMKVAKWHRETICRRGFKMLKDVHVPVKGMRMGENNELRVSYEHVYVFRKEP